MKSYSKLVLGTMAVAVLGLFSPALRAQDQVDAGAAKPVKIHGTIEKIDDKSITLKSDKGKSDSYNIDAKTQWGTKPEPKKASDFKVGDMVTVAVVKDAKGSFAAKAIYVPKTKPADAPKKEEKK